MIASGGFLAALGCTKFVFGRGTVPDPSGELTSLPQPSSWFTGAVLLRRGKGKGRKKVEKTRGNAEEGTEGDRR